MGRGLDYSTLIKLWKGHNTMRSAQQLKFLHFIRGRGRKLRQHSIDIALERRSHPAKPPSKSLSEFDAQADPPAVANVQVTTPEGFQEYPQGLHNGTRRLAHRLLAGDPRRRRSSSFSGAAAHQCHSGGRPRIRFRRGTAHQRLMGSLSCSPLVKYSIVT